MVFFFIQKQINGIFYVRYFVLFFSPSFVWLLNEMYPIINVFFNPKADKCHFLSWVFLFGFSPFLYLINKMKCIQISIQSRMNSLWYEKCYQSTSKQKSCERGCSFFMLSRHNAFWNGGKKINESSPQGRHGGVFLSVEWRCVWTGVYSLRK